MTERCPLNLVPWSKVRKNLSSAVWASGSFFQPCQNAGAVELMAALNLDDVISWLIIIQANGSGSPQLVLGEAQHSLQRVLELVQALRDPDPQLVGFLPLPIPVAGILALVREWSAWFLLRPQLVLVIRLGQSYKSDVISRDFPLVPKGLWCVNQNEVSFCQIKTWWRSNGAMIITICLLKALFQPGVVYILGAICRGVRKVETFTGDLRTMASVWTCLQFGIFFVPFVSSYGFRNCIESYDTPNCYNCVFRLLVDIESAVSDLPNNTRFLNISHNKIQTLYEGSFRRMPLMLQLRLDNNSLNNIEPGAFNNLGSLQVLNLSDNKISTLSPGVFRGLENLTYLFLNQNSLSKLHVGLFHPLSSLQFLNLSFNHLKSFNDLVGSIQPLQRLGTLIVCSNFLISLNHTHALPSSLSRLFLCKNYLQELNCHKDLFVNITSLDLSYNNLSSPSVQALNFGKIQELRLAFNVNFDIFHFVQHSSVPLNRIDYSALGLNNSSRLTKLCDLIKGDSLPSLTLFGNDIKYLANNTLGNCKVTNTLNLSRNRLRSISCLGFMASYELKSLIVEHNLLKRLISCKPRRHLFPKLKYVSLQFNRIWSVNGYAFQFAPNLEELRLNINNIIFLQRYAFSGLRRLQVLRLDNNLITDLYESSFQDLTELRILNLRNNRVSVIFNNVFDVLGNLTILDLGGNKITQLMERSFHGLRQLSKLYLDGNQITTITSNTFRHVETTLQVLDLMSNNIRYESSQKHFSPFQKLGKVYDLKLQNQQPYGLIIIPKGFFTGLKSLRDLYLSRNRLTHLSADVFDELSNLRYLTLAEDCNGVQNLPDGIFKNLTNLHVLDLENICLQTLNSQVFTNLTSLRKLQLMKNALKQLSVNVLNNMTNLRYLDLRKCPLTCTCNNEDLQHWLKQRKVQVVFPYNLTCPGRPDSYFHEFNANVCDMKLKLTLFCCSFPSLLLFLIIPIVYSKSYWRIKYNYFLFLAWLHERWKSEKEMYKYDAFVSYNNHDQEWVYNTMLPMLESWNPPSGLRLCLHHRDFQLGRDIIDNIVDSIHNSRRTICVVSREYLRSEWCSLEMQLASYKLFDEMRDVLVLVFLENIPDRELSTFHRMRKVMLKKTYIRWPAEPEGQKLFWAKLIKSLKGQSTPDTTVNWINTEQDGLLNSSPNNE
ncbi:LOW QUALITY PROTEIN: uncharacterized protein RCH25_008087 [Pelodytes ibericus]